jgi:hypothetical protein
MALALKQKPNWLPASGVLASQIPEPHYQVKYAGGVPVGWDEHEASTFSVEHLDQLVASGINLLSIPFYRGYGAEFEADAMSRAAELAKCARERKLRVGLRITVGATVPEILLAEDPEAHNWLQVSADGQPCVLSTPAPGVRVKPCFQSEGYQRYIEKICLRAVEVGADLVVLQEVSYNTEPDACRCPLCVSAFRERLRELYGPQSDETRAAGLERFGHHNFSHLRPPLYHAGQGATPGQLNAPHEQEWLLFKARTLGRFVSRLSKAIERQNGDCAVGADVLRTSERAAWAAGISMSELLPLLDVAALPCGDDTCAIAGRIHALKTARAFGVTACMPYVAGVEEASYLRAEVLANQPQGPVCASACADDAGRAQVAFYRDHRDALFAGATEVARIAVYSDTISLALNANEPHAGLAATERFLLDRHLPYSLLVPGQEELLSSFACVIVPDAECLSDAAAASLRSYVEAGGGLMVTGITGRCDAWRRPRAKPALAECLGEAYPSGSQVACGQGRASYVPCLKNEPALAEALRFVMGEQPLCVAAQRGRFSVTHYHLPSGAQTIHVVASPKTPVQGLEIALHCAQTPQEVLLFAPGQAPRGLSFSHSEAAQQVAFSCAEMPDYTVFLVR